MFPRYSKVMLMPGALELVSALNLAASRLLEIKARNSKLSRTAANLLGEKHEINKLTNPKMREIRLKKLAFKIPQLRLSIKLNQENLVELQKRLVGVINKVHFKLPPDIKKEIATLEENIEDVEVKIELMLTSI